MHFILRKSLFSDCSHLVASTFFSVIVLVLIFFFELVFTLSYYNLNSVFQLLDFLEEVFVDWAFENGGFCQLVFVHLVNVLPNR